MALRLGSSAKPNPATPSSAPPKIKIVPSGRAAIIGMTRLDGWAGTISRYSVISTGAIHHALNSPGRVIHLRLNGDAIIERHTKVRATADENCDGIRVRRVLRE